MVQLSSHKGYPRFLRPQSYHQVMEWSPVQKDNHGCIIIVATKPFIWFLDVVVVMVVGVVRTLMVLYVARTLRDRISSVQIVNRAHEHYWQG